MAQTRHAAFLILTAIALSASCTSAAPNAARVNVIELKRVPEFRMRGGPEDRYPWLADRGVLPAGKCHFRGLVDIPEPWGSKVSERIVMSKVAALGGNVVVVWASHYGMAGATYSCAPTAPAPGTDPASRSEGTSALATNSGAYGLRR
jgi:hypothetical protein